MVVDGSASLLFYMGMLLKRLEYDVYTSTTAEEALKIMKDVLPSLVITDITLPKMNGVTFLKKIKQDPRFKTIPVIIHTAESDPTIQDTSIRAGAARCISKPAEPEVLYRAIQAITETMPRQNIRLETSLKAVVGDGSVLGGAARTEYVTAISEGGMYIRTLYPQTVNALVPVGIFFSDKEIRVEAVVLYSFSVGEGPFKEPGMGMKFVKIEEKDRDFVRDYIKDQITKDIALRNE